MVPDGIARNSQIDEMTIVYTLRDHTARACDAHGPHKVERMREEQNSFSRFEWDEPKRLSNLAKHGIDFEDALLALQQPHVKMPSNKNGEARTLAICPDTHRLIAVVYTMRGDICRIISARAARKNEQRIYHQSFP